MIRIYCALCLIAFSLLGRAAGPSETPLALAAGAPERYIVVPGDTLWGISSKLLKEPWRWTELWRLNRDEIRNPNKIYPGDVIVLERDAQGNPLARLQSAKLAPKIHEERVGTEIPPIPPHVIEPFIAAPLVVETDRLQNSATIVATAQDRVFLGNQDTAYVSNADPLVVHWQIYRNGRPLYDPADAERRRILGYEAFHLGTARQVRSGSPATFEVLSAKQEIGRGDRLLPTVKTPINDYVPHRPDFAVDARVIATYGGLGAGRGSIVSFSQGAKEGIEIGHVLAIDRNRTVVERDERDVKYNVTIPAERFGLLFVFRTFDHISYGVILNADGTVEANDFVRTP